MKYAWGLDPLSNQIAQKLLDAGAVVTDNYFMWKCMVRAYKPLEQLKIMLKSNPKIDINHRNANGETCVFYRAQENDVEGFEYMVSLGADLTLKNSDGKGILQVTGNDKIRQLAKSKGLTETLSEEMAWEVELGNVTRVKELQAEGVLLPKKGRTYSCLLCLVAGNGGDEMIRYLATQGHAPKDEKEDSPLIYAINSRSWKTFKALVDLGADIKHVSANGRPLLHFAVGAINLEVVKYLVEHGIDVNQKDHHETALASLKRRNIQKFEGVNEMIQYMESKGARE